MIRPANGSGARLPRLRRPARQRRAAPRRRGVGPPGGRRTPIAAIDTFEGELEEALAPMSLTLRLEDELDVSRGELICRPERGADGRARARGRRLLDERRARCAPARAMRSSTPRAPRRRSSTGSTTCVDMHTLERDRRRRPSSGSTTSARVRLRTSAPLAFDPYEQQPPHRQLHPDRRGDERHRRAGMIAGTRLLDEARGRLRRHPLSFRGRCSRKVLVANRGEIAIRIVRALGRSASARSPCTPSSTAAPRTCGAQTRPTTSATGPRRRTT